VLASLGRKKFAGLKWGSVLVQAPETEGSVDEEERANGLSTTLARASGSESNMDEEGRVGRKGWGCSMPRCLDGEGRAKGGSTALARASGSESNVDEEGRGEGERRVGCGMPRLGVVEMIADRAVLLTGRGGGFVPAVLCLWLSVVLPDVSATEATSGIEVVVDIAAVAVAVVGECVMVSRMGSCP
jgi:hypothetical protein